MEICVLSFSPFSPSTPQSICFFPPLSLPFLSLSSLPLPPSLSFSPSTSTFFSPLVYLPLSLTLLYTILSLSPQESQQEHHQLYELLMQYLKARLALTAVVSKVEGLRKEYAGHQKQIWIIEMKSINSNVNSLAVSC